MEPVTPFLFLLSFLFYFIFKHSWLTVLCFRWTAKWFVLYIYLYLQFFKLQNIEHSSVFCMVILCWLSILNVAASTCLGFTLPSLDIFFILVLTAWFSVAVMCDSLQPCGCSMPFFPVLHYFPEFAKILVHWVGDAI